MKLNFRYKHLGHSDALEDYARDKIGHGVEKFFAHPIRVEVGFEVTAHDQSHSVSCHITSDHGQHFDAVESGDDMYACIDLLAEKVQGQLRKFKDKNGSHREARAVDKGFENVKPDGFELVDDTVAIDDGLGVEQFS